jgi:antibiotic biosynthesis monooxygenase (ABM) superfamily enzyme
MADNPIINIVSTKCQPKDEEKFNKWYNQVHIPMLLKAPQLHEVVRYKVIEESSKSPRYIAVYKFANRKDFEAFEKGPELAAGIKEMQGTWGKKVEITSVVAHELVKDFKKINI